MRRDLHVHIEIGFLQIGKCVSAAQKRLQAVGNSSGVIIDKPILELLRITPETELDI